MNRLTATIAAGIAASITAAPASAQARTDTLTEGTFFNVNDLTLDGVGNTSPDDFGFVIRGTTGEARSIAEFNVGALGLNAGRMVVFATYQNLVASTDVFDFGVEEGEVPDAVAALGFIGDGSASTSDFASGAGNQVGVAPTSDVAANSLIQYDVTAYVQQAVASGEDWVGFNLEALSFGGLDLFPNPAAGFPRLTIVSIPLPCPADITGEGTLNIDDVLAFLSAFSAGEPAADFAEPMGTFNVDDVLGFLGAFAAGCP